MIHTFKSDCCRFTVVKTVLNDITQMPVPSKFDIHTFPFLRPRIPRDIIFAFGGWSNGAASALMETYDSRVNKWFPVHTRTTPRAYHGIANLNGVIYVIGGFDGVNYFNTVQAYDPVRRSWKVKANMHQARCYVSTVVLAHSGKTFIYACGGYDGIHRTNTCERYDPDENQWYPISPMNHQRSDASAAVLNGKLYIVGGFDGHEVLQTVEEYDPETNQWRLIESMTRPRSGVQCVAYDDCLYVFGGNDGNTRQNSAEKFDPFQRTWTMLAEMRVPRSNFSTAVLEDQIYIIGGFNGMNTIHDVEMYDIRTNKWFEMWPMQQNRSALGACVVERLPNGREYSWLQREQLRPSNKVNIKLRTTASESGNLTVAGDESDS